MSKSIKVLVDTDPSIDIGKLSPEERSIIFDKLAEENPGIHAEIFARFLEATDETIHRELQLDKPNIAEILTKRIILLSANIANEFFDFRRINLPNSILPVILNFSPTGTVSGSAVPIMHQVLKPKFVKSVSSASIKVRLDRPILTLDHNLRPYISNTNEDLYVVGLQIYPKCARSLQNFRQVDQKRTRLDGYSGNLQNPREYRTINNVLPMGSYNWKDIFDSCNDLFLRGDVSIPSDYVKIVDDAGPLLKVLGDIFDYAVSTINANPSAGRLYHRIIDMAIGDTVNTADTADNIERKQTAIVNMPMHRALLPMRGDRISIPPLIPLTAESGILYVMEGLGSGKFWSESKLALTADLYGRGLSGIYYSASLAGVDSAIVNTLIDKYRSRREKLKFTLRVKLERAEKESRNGTIRMLINRKLGTKRVTEISKIIKQNPTILQTDGLLLILSNDERKQIESEYNRLIKYSKEVIGNKCPHVGLVRKLRRSRDDYTSNRVMSELRVLYAKGGKHSAEDLHMIKCKLCGFDIICPHVDVMYTQSNNTSHALKSALTKYIAKGASDLHCKVCGESLSTIDELEGIEIDRNDNVYKDEELKNFIWSEVAINMRYFKFAPLIDLNKVITRVRDSIYDYVSAIELQILKSKTTSTDELKAKKRLFTNIYTFAQMIHMVLSNMKTGSVKFRDYKVSDPRKAIPELIKKSIDIIMLSRVSIIREIPGMTVDVIKNNLISAYKIVQTGKIEELNNNDPGDLSIEFDPIFNSAVLIEVLRRISDGKPINYDMIEDSLHKKVVEGVHTGKKTMCVDDGKSLFKDIIHTLTGNAFNTEMFYKLSAPNGKNYLTNTNTKTVYAAAMPGYIAASYNIIVKQVLEKLYNMHAAKNAEAYENGNAMLEEEFARLRIAEDYLMRYRALQCVQGFVDPTRGLQRKYSYPDVSITRIYDEDGAEHKFNIWISDDGKTRTEFTSRDIAKQLESGKRFSQPITDKKCSVCGILWSRVDTLDPAKIRESLKAKATLENFFRFYESRCPRGDLHIYKAAEGAESVCTKCGMVVMMTSGTKNSLNTYRQYKEIYNRDREELIVDIVPDVPEPKAPRDTSSLDTQYDSWAPNFSAVVDLAERLGINQRLFLALGATEHIDYTDIANGKYIPPEVDERCSTRIYTLNAYIRSLYIEWSQLRTFYRLLKPNSELSQLIEKSGVNRSELHDVMAAMPDIYDDFSLRFEHVQWKMKPRMVVSFCIQSFCEKCLLVLKPSKHPTLSKQVNKISGLFVEYIVTKILRNDELLSKPGYFSWSIIFGEKETKDDTAGYAEGETNEPVVPEDDTNEAAFSMEAFDVEEDTGDMPDDDPGNQIRVEGMGMD